ncbi:hypothetical protein PM082_007700 [Marasmius tenuissimus]|nr:hypothetical protein PM082_007700 [Marasmius tenuissimus]
MPLQGPDCRHARRESGQGNLLPQYVHRDCIYNEAEVGRVQRTYAKGHQIASHTWAHAHLNSLSKDQITSEFTRSQDAIEKITGAKVAFTRPPYGEYNDVVEQVASEQNQALVLWDFDSADSAGADANQIRQNYQTW